MTKKQRQLLEAIATATSPKSQAVLARELGWSSNATRDRVHLLCRKGLVKQPEWNEGLRLTSHGTFEWLCIIRRRCQFQEFVRVSSAHV